MASNVVTAAPEAISGESAKTNVADRQAETQPLAVTTHADDTTPGVESSVAGESKPDLEPISSISTNKTDDRAELVKGKAAQSKGAYSIQPKIGSTLSHHEIITQMEEKVFGPIRDEMTVVVKAQHAMVEQINQLASGVVKEQNRGYGVVKKILLTNYELISAAKKEFGAQGRQVPVTGKPTYTEWLNERFTITLPDGTKESAVSDRYVRKVMAQGRDLFDQALDTANGDDVAALLEPPKSTTHKGANGKSGDGKVPHERKPLADAPVDKAALAEVEEAMEKPHKTAAESSHSLYKPGNWMALYSVLDNFGNPGLVPLDAVLGGLEPEKVVANVARLAEQITTQFCNGRKVRVTVELAD